MYNGQEKSFHLSRKQKLKSINNKQSNDSDIRSNHSEWIKIHESVEGD